MDVAVGDEQILVAVAIDIEELSGPPHEREAAASQAACRGDVLEVAVAEIAIEGVGVVLEVGDEDVEPAVIVEVGRRGPHARLLATVAAVSGAAEQSPVLQRPVSGAAVQEVDVGIVGNVDLGQPVVVAVGGDQSKAEGRVGVDLLL